MGLTSHTGTEWFMTIKRIFSFRPFFQSLFIFCRNSLIPTVFVVIEKKEKIIFSVHFYFGESKENSRSKANRVQLRPCPLSISQRLLNCGALLALFNPGFFLSLMRASRRRNPARFRSWRKSGFKRIRARLRPCLRASDCDEIGR